MPAGSCCDDADDDRSVRSSPWVVRIFAPSSPTRRRVRRMAFDSLDVPARALIVLHHLEERTTAEIASVLGIPAGTVKSRLFTARRTLEQALEQERT